MFLANRRKPAEPIAAELKQELPNLQSHSWLSKTRSRLPHEVHQAAFDRVFVIDQINPSDSSFGERKAMLGLDRGVPEIPLSAMGRSADHAPECPRTCS